MHSAPFSCVDEFSSVYSAAEDVALRSEVSRYVHLSRHFSSAEPYRYSPPLNKEADSKNEPSISTVLDIGATFPSYEPGVRIIAGGLPFPLPTLTADDIIKTLEADKIARVEARDDVFQYLEIPAIGDSRSVIKDWETISQSPRCMPKGIEDRWRTYVPPRSFTVRNLRPANFIAAVRYNIFKQRKLSSTCQNDGSDSRRPIYVDAKPSESLALYWREHKKVIDRLLNSKQASDELSYLVSEASSSPTTDAERTTKAHQDLDECDVHNTLVWSCVRWPMIEETVEILTNHCMRDWESKLHPSEQRRLTKIRQQEDPKSRHPGRKKPPVRYGGDEKNIHPLRLNNISIGYTRAELETIARAVTKCESYKLCCDYGSRRFNSSTNTNVNRAIFPHFIATKSIESKGGSTRRMVVSKNAPFTNDGEIDCSNISVISVSFFHNSGGHLMAEYDCLSTNTLADICDVFKACDEDHLRFSSDTFRPTAMFYIGGVIYVDTRESPNSPSPEISYQNAVLLLQSLRSKCENVLEHPISMHAVTLADIDLPLLDRCYFIHQGDCEHRVLFSSIRSTAPFNLSMLPRSRCLTIGSSDGSNHNFEDETNCIPCISGGDCPYLEAYPLRTYERNMILTSCELCRIHQPTVFVFNCRSLQKNPTHICEDCKTRFLLSQDGDLLDKGTVIIPFVQPT